MWWRSFVVLKQNSYQFKILQYIQYSVTESLPHMAKLVNWNSPSTESIIHINSKETNSRLVLQVCTYFCKQSRWEAEGNFRQPLLLYILISLYNGLHAASSNLKCHYVCARFVVVVQYFMLQIIISTSWVLNNRTCLFQNNGFVSFTVHKYKH